VFVRLAGNATFGGTNRFDIRGTGSVLNLAGFTLTKTGTNTIWGNAFGTISNGTVEVLTGGFGLAAATSGADVAVNVYSGATHWLQGDAGAYAHRVTLAGGRLATSNGAGGAILRGPLTAASNSTIHCDGLAPLTLTNAVGGPGQLTLSATNAGGTLILATAATNTGGWVIASGTLQAGDGGTRGSIGTNSLFNRGVFRLNRSDTITVFNAISGTGMLVHAGSGRVVMAGPLALTGLVSATAGGTLVFDGSGGHAFHIPTPTGVRAFNLEGGATALLTNQPVLNTRGIVALGASAISNEGHVIQYSGTWTVDGNDLANLNRAFIVGEWSDATSTFTQVGGTLIVTNGRVYVPWRSALGVWNMASATAVVRQLNFNAGTPGHGQLNFASGALIIGPGGINNSTGTVTLNLGGGRIGAYANWTGNAAMNLTGTNGPTVFDPGTNRITLTGVLTGTGGLVKAGSGELVLGAYNTLTGRVEVVAGTLSLNNPAASGPSVMGSGPLIIQTGATVNAYISAFGLAESNSPLNPIVVNRGTLNASQDAAIRDVTLTAGTLSGSFTEFQTAWDLTVNADADESVISANLRLLSNLTFRVADGAASNDLRITGSLVSSNGGWNKAGPGTLAFEGSDNGVGPSIISNGTFVLAGQINNTSELRVAAGATLAGGGTTFGPLYNRGTCAPGNPIGQLLTFLSYEQDAAATLELSLGGASAPGTDYDRLYAFGTVGLAGTLRVTLTNGFVPAYGDTFFLITGGSLTGTFASIQLPPLPASNAWEVANDGSSLTLTVTTNSPPPTTYGDFAALYGLAEDPTGDDDDDGYANLLEYATGGHPGAADQQARLTAFRTNGVLAVRFTRNTNATDAILTVEGALAPTNGAIWTGFATNLAGNWGSATNVSETPDDPAAVTVRDIAPASTNRFLRLRVRIP
jgi:fibronectin-binding autotransporter adhesin